jgi:hypothetical protein
MARWQVELRGDETDSTLLVALFTAPDLRVVRDDDAFLLESSELEPLGHRSEVFRAAKQILCRTNGAARLQNPSYRNVTVGAIREHRPNGTRATSVFVEPATIDVRATVFPPTIVGGVPTTPVASPASRFAEAASRDHDAHDALDRWANESHNWVNLYKVFEIVRSRGGTSLAGVSDKELSRFTHTANHEKGGGREARHARLGTDPPKDPMSLLEAEQLIARLLKAWLASIP